MDVRRHRVFAAALATTVGASLLAGCSALGLSTGSDSENNIPTAEPRVPTLNVTTAESAPVDTLSTASSEPIANPSRDLTRNVQSALNARGIDAGPADGYAGKKTVLAIRIFKIARRMEVTDYITPQLLDELDI